jgi:hypothetical protein
MNPRDRFDELERERQYEEKLGLELRGFIDHSREPHEYLIEGYDEDDDVLNLKCMGLAPFLKRDDND